MGGKRALVLTVFILWGFLRASSALSCDQAVQLYNQAIGQQDLQQKESLYRKALSVPCSDQSIRAKIHNNLGDTYEKMGRTGEALAEYRQATTLDPDFATPYLGIGDIYSRAGQEDEARVWYDRGFVLSMYKTKDEIIEALDPKRTLRAIMVKPVSQPPTVSQASVPESAKPPLIPEAVLYFGFDQASLTPEASRQLQRLLDAFNDDRLAGYRFRIAGHTCSLGSATHNQKLSEKRAAQVRGWLVARGISEDRLVVQGFGENRPISDNSREETRRLNRRVEIRTIGVVTAAAQRGGDEGSLEGARYRKEGERLLVEERYREAASAFEKAYTCYKSKGHKQGMRDALNDLLLVSLYLHDGEKAKSYAKEMERLK